jgi:hypothetical protein
VESARVVSGLLSIPANSTAASAVRLYEDTDNGTNYVDIIAPSAITSDRTLTIPDASGTIDRLNRAGNVLQVVQTVKTNIFTTTSTSFVDVTGLSVNITPTSSSSKVLVFLSCVCTGGVTNVVSQYSQLVRDSTAIMSCTIGAPAGDQPGVISLIYLDSPNTTSSTTYKLQTRGDGALVGINTAQSQSATDYGDSSITVMEIAG